MDGLYKKKYWLKARRINYYEIIEEKCHEKRTMFQVSFMMFRAFVYLYFGFPECLFDLARMGVSEGSLEIGCKHSFKNVFDKV